MKASNIVIVICCCLSVGYGLYLKYFAEAYDALSRINQAKEGMTREQVTAALAAPDSVYWQKSEGDSLLVMSYKLSGDNKSSIRVKLRNDTVRAVKYHK
jgi:hypothetical protein